MIEQFLDEIQAAFGECKAALVEVDGKTILSQGTFAEPRRFYNGRMRAYR